METKCSPDKHAWEYTGMIKPTACGLWVMKCKKCGVLYDMPAKEYKSFSFMKKLEENGIIGVIK